MKSALITGAAGFVGSHLLERVLTHTNWDTVTVDSLRHGGTSDHLTTIRGYDPARVTQLTHDLAAPFSGTHWAAVANADPTLIFNVGSRCSVDQSIEDPAGFIANNIMLAINVLELTRNWVDVTDRRFFQMSTDEVYGPDRANSHYDHRPSSPYSASKAAQEDIANAYRRTYQIPLTIVRSANIFGERQSTLAFIPKIIRAIMGGTPIDVHGGGRRSYVYVGNVVSVILAAADSVNAPELVEIAGQQTLSNLELVELVGELMGEEPEIRMCESPRPGYDRQYPELASPPTEYHTGFVDGLHQTIDWAVKHPTWLGVR